MNNDNKKPLLPIRVSISEASRLFGVSTKTIRQAIKNQEIRYIVVKNRYKINFESVLRWSQLSTRRKNILSTEGIGKFVEKWKIKNRKYSPNPELIDKLRNDYFKPEK
ncbi:helix-turn-helix domain-containing protein [Patescibacteria group bacterium]|nr:helix-turn-helix domain-containing protein [Patescibacteria group bacterium]